MNILKTTYAIVIGKIGASEDFILSLRHAAISEHDSLGDAIDALTEGELEDRLSGTCSRIFIYRIHGTDAEIVAESCYDEADAHEDGQDWESIAANIAAEATISESQS